MCLSTKRGWLWLAIGIHQQAAHTHMISLHSQEATAMQGQGHPWSPEGPEKLPQKVRVSE